MPAVTVQPPSTTDIDNVNSGKLALVLFRIRTTVDGKVISPLDAVDPNRSARIYLANLGELGTPGQIRATSPSEAAALEGWRHMLLPPGTYYMLVLPPGVEQNPPAVAFHAPGARFGRLTQYKFEPGRGGFWSPELTGFIFTGTPPQDFQVLPGFWFQVPGDEPVVYLGMLSSHCSSGHGLFGSLIGSCSDYDILVDSEAAQRIIADTWPELGGVATEPLAVYGKSRDAMRLQDRGAMDIVMQDTATLGVAYTGAQMSSRGVIQGAPPIYNLLAIAAESAARSSARNEAEQRVVEARPCLQHLAGTLPDIDIASLFTTALAAAAHSQGIVPGLDNTSPPAVEDEAGRVRQRLSITIPILHLRESVQPQYLALELGLHLRLETGSTRRVVYDSLLLYGGGFPVQNPLEQGSRLYERLVSQHAQPQPMSEWCGTNGAALLRKEIGIGLQYIAGQFASDLE